MNAPAGDCLQPQGIAAVRVRAQDEQVFAVQRQKHASVFSGTSRRCSTAAAVQEEVHDCIRPIGPDKPIDSNRLNADCVR